MVNEFGRKGNRLTHKQKKMLKVSPRLILENNITNLNLRSMPADFQRSDLVHMTEELNDYRLVINMPYNRTQDTFHDYAFILMTNSRSAAFFCEKWDKVSVTGFTGDTQQLQVHQGNLSPKNFLIHVLKSKVVFDADPKKRPKFFLDKPHKARFMLNLLNMSHDMFVEQFNYLRVNSDFDIFFTLSSIEG